MRQRQTTKLLLLVLLFSFFVAVSVGSMMEKGLMMRLTKDTVMQDGFRSQEMGEQMFRYLEQTENRGENAGLYLLETKFGYQRFPYSYNEKIFLRLKKKWTSKKEWGDYLTVSRAVWDDIQYFPVPISVTNQKLQTSFENSWMSERNYGGKRGHEGCDIMASENVRGLYPVVSMTDGVIENKGWLEKGGYRIGIRAPSGGYFYYAHLDSYADVQEGEQIKAGDIIGFMGDSGYGKEGTKGKFPVHLHIGIYIYPKGREVSVNPYWILRYLKNYQLKCAYSDEYLWRNP